MWRTTTAAVEWSDDCEMRDTTAGMPLANPTTAAYMRREAALRYGTDRPLLKLDKIINCNGHWERGAAAAASTREGNHSAA